MVSPGGYMSGGDGEAGKVAVASKCRARDHHDGASVGRRGSLRTGPRRPRSDHSLANRSRDVYAE